MILLLCLLSLAPARVEAALSAAAAAQLDAVIETQDNAAELRAIWQVECSGRYPCRKVSRAGACGPFQALGSRYGNPPCKELERSPWLAVMTAQAELRYWQKRCGQHYLSAYNAGHKGCRGEAGQGYAARVRRIGRGR